MSAGITRVQSIQCPNCSASVDFNPEDVIITCSFCGEIFTQARQEIKNHKLVEPQVSIQEAEKKIYNWIRKKTRFRGIKNIQVTKLEKILLPYWVMYSHATTHFRGYKRETVSESESYTDSQGNRKTRTKQVTIYKPVNRTIDEDRYDPLICRMGVTLFGINEINKAVTRTVIARNYDDFSVDKLRDDVKDVKFLSGEIKKAEAKEIIETKIQDEHRSQARAQTTELFDCRTLIQLKGLEFLHYPIVYMEYVSGKETYRVVMDGATKKILLAELPVTTKYRVFNEAIAFFMVFLVYGMTIGYQFYVKDSPVRSQDAGLWAIGITIVYIIIFYIAFRSNNIAWSTETRSKE